MSKFAFAQTIKTFGWKMCCFGFAQSPLENLLGNAAYHIALHV